MPTRHPPKKPGRKKTPGKKPGAKKPGAKKPGRLSKRELFRGEEKLPDKRQQALFRSLRTSTENLKMLRDSLEPTSYILNRDIKPHLSSLLKKIRQARGGLSKIYPTPEESAALLIFRRNYNNINFRQIKRGMEAARTRVGEYMEFERLLQNMMEHLYPTRPKK